jgi:hypothetical protein
MLRLKNWILLFLLLVSLTALVSQTIGIFLAPRSQISNGGIPGYNYATMDRRHLKEILESPEDYNINEINQIIFFSLPHGSPAQLSVAHNWVLWLLSKWKGDSLRFTQKASFIARSNAAICSQKARLLVEICKRMTVPARLVSYDGHVICEVFVDKKWLSYDPDYGVYFAVDAEALSDAENKNLVISKLRERRFNDDLINYYLKSLSNGPPLRHAIWEAHEPKPAWIEQWSLFISWSLPIFCILSVIILLLRPTGGIYN